jgi:hypothetical protein
VESLIEKADAMLELWLALILRPKQLIFDIPLDYLHLN